MLKLNMEIATLRAEAIVAEYQLWQDAEDVVKALAYRIALIEHDYLELYKLTHIELPA